MYERYLRFLCEEKAPALEHMGTGNTERPTAMGVARNRSISDVITQQKEQSRYKEGWLLFLRMKVMRMKKDSVRIISNCITDIHLLDLPPAQ